MFREKAALLLGIVAVSLIPYAISFFAIVVLGVRPDQLLPASMGIIGTILGIFAGIALVYALSGRQHTVSDAYQASTGVFWKYLVLSILLALITLVGLILLVIPGIIVAVWFSFAIYVLLLEDKRPIEALKASRAYVQGKWWAVFGRLVALSLMAAVALIAVTSPFTFFLNDIALEFLMTLLTMVVTPIGMGYIYLMYKDISTSMPEEHLSEISPE